MNLEFESFELRLLIRNAQNAVAAAHVQPEIILLAFPGLIFDVYVMPVCEKC
jgi:hypothetical protein